MAIYRHEDTCIPCHVYPQKRELLLLILHQRQMREPNRRISVTIRHSRFYFCLTPPKQSRFPQVPGITPIPPSHAPSTSADIKLPHQKLPVIFQHRQHHRHITSNLNHRLQQRRQKLIGKSLYPVKRFSQKVPTLC